MIMGMMAAQMRTAGGGAPLWTPLNMATVPQIYLDAQDSVVTDVSGACSAISNLGAMGANGDFSQTSSGYRPAILPAELNGKKVLRFDGSNDVITSGSTAARGVLKAAPVAWAFNVYKKRSVDPSPTFRNLVYVSTGTGPGLAVRFSVFSGSGQADGANKRMIQGRRLDADALALITSPNPSYEGYCMSLAIMGITANNMELRLDGAVEATGTTIPGSSPVTSTSDSYHALAIGATPFAGSASDVDLACTVLSNSLPSAQDIDKLFGWAAHKYGLTANLPGGHPYKTVAPTI
ncbi:hypothetical protein [Pseudomonas paeninsulae]|uniref:hypothetical protein n=1 Tax=Pseudomonas paeninsulae TaxID=3110772 RepID=UPI002D787347|nr:hypothetical protein [Pseudomonas sp. IT1137]